MDAARNIFGAGLDFESFLYILGVFCALLSCYNRNKFILRVEQRKPNKYAHDQICLILWVIEEWVMMGLVDRWYSLET